MFGATNIQITFLLSQRLFWGGGGGGGKSGCSDMQELSDLAD